MISVTHAAVGAAIGQVARHPALSAVLGWCSHFALDALPHWGRDRPERFLVVARADGVVMLAVSAALVAAARPDRRISVAAGVFAAVAPDLNKPVRHFFSRSLYPQWLDRFHASVQQGKESPDRLASEVAKAAAAVAAAAWVVRTYR